MQYAYVRQMALYQNITLFARNIMVFFTKNEGIIEIFLVNHVNIITYETRNICNIIMRIYKKRCVCYLRFTNVPIVYTTYQNCVH